MSIQDTLNGKKAQETAETAKESLAAERQQVDELKNLGHTLASMNGAAMMMSNTQANVFSSLKTLTTQSMTTSKTQENQAKSLSNLVENQKIANMNRAVAQPITTKDLKGLLKSHLKEQIKERLRVPEFKKPTEILSALSNKIPDLKGHLSKMIKLFALTTAGNQVTRGGEIMDMGRIMTRLMLRVFGRTVTTAISEIGNALLSKLNLAALVAILVIKLLPLLIFGFAVIMTLLKKVLGNLGKVIVGHVKRVFAFYKKVFGAIFNAIGKIVSSIWNGIKTIAGAVWNGIKWIGNTVWKGIKTVGSFFASIPGRIFRFVKGIVTGLRDKVISIVEHFFPGITAKVKGMFNAIKAKLFGIFGHIKDVIGNVFGNFKDIVSNIFSKIADKIGAIVDTVKSVFGNVWNVLTSLPGKIIDGLKSIPGAIWSGIKSFFGSDDKKAEKVKEAEKTPQNVQAMFNYQGMSDAFETHFTRLTSNIEAYIDTQSTEIVKATTGLQTLVSVSSAKIIESLATIVEKVSKDPVIKLGNALMAQLGKAVSPKEKGGTSTFNKIASALKQINNNVILEVKLLNAIARGNVAVAQQTLNVTPVQRTIQNMKTNTINKNVQNTMAPSDGTMMANETAKITASPGLDGTVTDEMFGDKMSTVIKALGVIAQNTAKKESTGWGPSFWS